MVIVVFTKINYMHMKLYLFKTILIFSLFFISSNLFCQDTTKVYKKSDKWCVEWLYKMRPMILADSLGRYGARESAIERLQIEGCNFEGQLFPFVEYFFGPPDVRIDLDDSDLSVFGSTGISFRYYLHIPKGISDYGTKKLIFKCDNNYRIEKVETFTVDE